jgi:hypothetical protein
MQNEKKLVVLFPGFGYGPDKPLLYYAAKVARRQGLDCMVVQYSQLFPHEETPQASAAKSYPGAAQDAMTQIPAGYDRYICIAKSFGTMVAAGWVKAHPEYHVTLLQLTPLAWEYAPLYAGMPAWHATGTADRWAVPRCAVLWRMTPPLPPILWRAATIRWTRRRITPLALRR